jgi:hypothetical protein
MWNEARLTLSPSLVCCAVKIYLHRLSQPRESCNSMARQWPCVRREHLGGYAAAALGRGVVGVAANRLEAAPGNLGSATAMEETGCG